MKVKTIDIINEITREKENPTKFKQLIKDALLELKKGNDSYREIVSSVFVSLDEEFYPEFYDLIDLTHPMYDVEENLHEFVDKYLKLL